MAQPESPYYPPRAHWYAPLYYLSAELRRRLALDRVRLPSGVGAPQVFAGVLVPGLAVWLRGSRLWGQAALSACALLALVFVVWLGRPAGNLAFGMLLSVHSTGFTYLCEPWLDGARLRTRMVFSLAVLLVLGGLLYMPVFNLIQDRWLVPLRVQDRVVVVRKMASAGIINRGDWIAFSIPVQHGEGIYSPGWTGLGPVLAVPGDRVVFSSASFIINGVSRPLRRHMPSSGEWVVPEKHWFVWPDLDISGHGIPETEISVTILRMATISQDQFAGKPFKRWFWRRQTLS